jgi:arsenate reductase
MSRRDHEILESLDVETVNYYVDPISGPKLKDLLRKMRITARDLLRTNEAIYRELNLAKQDLSDDQLVALMMKHPDLIQRPIVENGDRAILARPADRLKEIL